ncbi:MAG: adenosylcobinamide-GDP ribazoletransferase [Oscillospiraceae bacterium]|nr:adenosylcobinamide-GDP ribazoletransferase [Oscillospiraceae bacterium]
MTIWETVIVAFSMFSALPMPQIEWNEKNMRYSLCAFPLIGAVIGLAGWGWVCFCAALALPAVLRGAGLCLLPVLITGGIHLDGYADTCDALASHGSVEKRQEILKDPHLGAFAAIRLGVYFVASFALWTALGEVKLLPLVCLFGLSRSLSGLALTVYPLREGSGLARSFADAADKKRVRAVLLALSCALAIVLALGGAAEVPAVAALVFWRYGRVAKQDFGGVSGDLAGWFLQKAELWMLAAWCLGQYVRNTL